MLILVKTRQQSPAFQTQRKHIQLEYQFVTMQAYKLIYVIELTPTPLHLPPNHVSMQSNDDALYLKLLTKYRFILKKFDFIMNIVFLCKANLFEFLSFTDFKNRLDITFSHDSQVNFVISLT